MSKREIHLDMEADEILEAYADYLTENWAAEYDAILGKLNQEDAESAAEQSIEDGKIVREIGQDTEKLAKRSVPSPVKKHLRQAAIFIGTIVIINFGMPVTEVSAWRIWNLDFLFQEQEDHMDMIVDSRNPFPQYYIDEVPEGYTVTDEEITAYRYYVKYEDEEGQFIIFMQTMKEGYKGHADSENMVSREETIGDFDFLVVEGDNCIVFEATTDTEALVINTNVSYDTAKQFISSLKEY